MNCEEFEILGLDAQRDGSVDEDGRERALQHARVCGRCAALGASWAAAQAELSALAESSRLLRVPARLEITIGKKTTVQPYVKRDQFGPELLYFSDCILNNRTPEPSGLEGMVDVHIIRSLYKAAQTGRVVTLKKFPRHQRPNLRQEIHRAVVKPLGKVDTTKTKK